MLLDSFINFFIDLFSCNFDVDLCGMTPETYTNIRTDSLSPSWARATGYTPTGQSAELVHPTGPTGPQGNFDLDLVYKQNETFCTIWYHLYNLKNMKNTDGGVIDLVKFQVEACNFTKSNTPPCMLFTFFQLYK